MRWIASTFVRGYAGKSGSMRLTPSESSGAQFELPLRRQHKHRRVLTVARVDIVKTNGGIEESGSGFRGGIEFDDPDSGLGEAV